MQVKVDLILERYAELANKKVRCQEQARRISENEGFSEDKEHALLAFLISQDIDENDRKELTYLSRFITNDVNEEM